MTETNEGIYLETKQSKLGTGHTASQVTFRNFYAVRPAPGGVEIFLLDNQLVPTGIAEVVTAEELSSRGWQYVPQLQARYDGLKAGLKSPAPAAPAAAGPAAAAPPARPAAPAAPAPPAKPKEPDKPKEQAWWELTSRGSDALIKK